MKKRFDNRTRNVLLEKKAFNVITAAPGEVGVRTGQKPSATKTSEAILPKSSTGAHYSR